MSKFNTTGKRDETTVGTSVNLAGGKSYARDGFKQDIASIVLNSMLNGDSYYQTEASRVKNIENLITSNLGDAEFVAKAMVYTRTVGNLRSVSHLLATLLVENAKGTNYLRNALNKTIIRPDDTTEMVALFSSRNKDAMIPNSLKRAIRDSFETKWDAYQLKKYEGKKNAVKLKDVVKLTHPNPRFLFESGKVDDVKIFKRLIEGTLDNIQTAQTVNAGSVGTERASNYESMLSEKKLGYLAALKNIKNILESKPTANTITMLCDLLRNERAVRNSRVLPFRFLQAYREIDAMNTDRILVKKVLNAIEAGFTLSAKNVSIIDENETVAILLDESGSMSSGNTKSTLSPFDIGKALMASILTGIDKSAAVGYLWADRAREISVNGSPMEFIKNTRTQGGGTDVWGAMSKLIETKTKVDKIIIITDLQMYGVSGGYGRGPREFKDMVKEYQRLVNPDVKILFWNVVGYSSGTPVKITNDIMEISGFSDNLLEVAAKMLKFNDKDYLIKEIESIVL